MSPLLAPSSAPWPSGAYSSPGNREVALPALTGALAGLVLAILALRVYSRITFRCSFGGDDWMVIAGAAFFVAASVVTILGSLLYHWGSHVWDLTLSDRRQALLLSWLAGSLTTWCLVFTKLSLCVFYLRFLATRDGGGGVGGGGCRVGWDRNKGSTNKRLIFALVAVILVWGVGFTAAIVFRCSPVQAAYIPNYPGGTCSHSPQGPIAHVVGDIVTNLALFILAVRKLWAMRLAQRQQVLLLGVFALGGLVCTAGVLRLPATVMAMADYDETKVAECSFIWVNVECGLAIVVASAPPLAPLLIRHVPALTPSQLRLSQFRHHHGEQFVKHPPGSHPPLPPLPPHLPPQAPSARRFKSTFSRAFVDQRALQGVCGSPLADISTTVTGCRKGDKHHRSGGGGGGRAKKWWWTGTSSKDDWGSGGDILGAARVGGCGGGDSATKGDGGEDGNRVNVRPERSITLTTVIEQTVQHNNEHGNDKKKENMVMKMMKLGGR